MQNCLHWGAARMSPDLNHYPVISQFMRPRSFFDPSTELERYVELLPTQTSYVKSSPAFSDSDPPLFKNCPSFRGRVNGSRFAKNSPNPKAEHSPIDLSGSDQRLIYVNVKVQNPQEQR